MCITIQSWGGLQVLNGHVHVSPLTHHKKGHLEVAWFQPSPLTPLAFICSSHTGWCFVLTTSVWLDREACLAKILGSPVGIWTWVSLVQTKDCNLCFLLTLYILDTWFAFPFTDLMEESPELAVPTNMSTAADLLKQGAGKHPSQEGGLCLCVTNSGEYNVFDVQQFNEIG